MSKTQAERSAEYRRRKRDAKRDVTECDAPSVTDIIPDRPQPAMLGPLDVYSEQRWSYLRSQHYDWDHIRLRAFSLRGIRAVTIPGDPRYTGCMMETA